MVIKINKVVEASILCSPLFAFSYFNEGSGIIQISIIILLIAIVIESIKRKGLKLNRLVFGNKISLIFVCTFCTYILFSLSYFQIFNYNTDVDFRRRAGVSISLLVLILTYYLYSYFSRNLKSTNQFIKIFILTGNIVTLSIIVEFFLWWILKVNYFNSVLGFLHSLLPYPAPPWSDTVSHGRFRGVLNEPGDIGNIVIPVFAANIIELKNAKYIKNHSQYLKKSIVLLLQLISIIISYSTTCYIVTFIFLALYSINNESFTNVKKLAYSISALILSTIIFFGSIEYIFYLIKPLLNNNLLDRIEALVLFFQSDYFDNNTNASVKAILVSWDATTKVLSDNFLFGSGIGNISSSITKSSIELGIYDVYNILDGYSMFLRLTNELGATGFILFVGIFWARLSQGIKIRRVINESNLNNIDKEILYTNINKVNAACFICLLNALVNYPTYWNLILPMILGISYKCYYIKEDSKVTP